MARTSHPAALNASKVMKRWAECAWAGMPTLASRGSSSAISDTEEEWRTSSAT